MHENVRLFDLAIRAAGAQTTLYMTWARRDAPASQEAIADAYTGIGQELGATVVPVGLAWQKFVGKHDRPGAAGMAFAGKFFDCGRDEVVFVVFACSYGLAALCWLAVDATRPEDEVVSVEPRASGARTRRYHPTAAGAEEGPSIMSACRVALVGLDGQSVPDWVAAGLTKEGIDLVAHECRTDEELAHSGRARRRRAPRCG
jgi:hypothetical protein